MKKTIDSILPLIPEGYPELTNEQKAAVASTLGWTISHKSLPVLRKWFTQRIILNFAKAYQKDNDGAIFIDVNKIKQATSQLMVFQAQAKFKFDTSTIELIEKFSDDLINEGASNGEDILINMYRLLDKYEADSNELNKDILVEYMQDFYDNETSEEVAKEEEKEEQKAEENIKKETVIEKVQKDVEPKEVIKDVPHNGVRYSMEAIAQDDDINTMPDSNNHISKSIRHLSEIIATIDKFMKPIGLVNIPHISTFVKVSIIKDYDKINETIETTITDIINILLPHKGSNINEIEIGTLTRKVLELNSLINKLEDESPSKLDRKVTTIDIFAAL